MVKILDAVKNGHLHAVEWELESGVDIETRDRDNCTALLWAACFGYADIVTLLLAHGANIEARDNDRNTPLILAAAFGHINVLKLLLLKGANTEAKDSNYDTALTLAVKLGEMEMVQLLFKNGAYEHAKAKINITAQMSTYFTCPISKKIMQDPITTLNGQTYDRGALKAYFNSKNNPEVVLCPLSSEFIYKFELNNQTNAVFKKLIDTFIESAKPEIPKILSHEEELKSLKSPMNIGFYAKKSESSDGRAHHPHTLQR